MEMSLDFQAEKTALISSPGESQKQSHTKAMKVMSHAGLAQPAGEPPTMPVLVHQDISLSLFPATLGVLISVFSSRLPSFKVSACPTTLLTFSSFPPLSRADISSQIPARNNKIHMLDFFSTTYL